MKTFKKIWFLVLLALLALPMLQTIFHFVDEKPLDGAYVPAKKPVITLKTLYYEGFVDTLMTKQDSSMTTQDSLMSWCTEQTGFRNAMIRVNNQLLYSAFGKIPVTSLVKGTTATITSSMCCQSLSWARPLITPSLSPMRIWPNEVKPTTIKPI